jgi:hypothetical protein
MIREYYCVVIVILLSGCALLKNSKKESDLEKQSASLEWRIKQSLQSNTTRSGSSLLLRRDSGTNTFRVRIWPKGAFTFSVENGFAGTADSIAWFGNSEGLRSASSRQQSLEKNSSVAQTTVKAASAERAEQKKTKNESWLPLKWVLAGGLVLALAAWYVLRRIRK